MTSVIVDDALLPLAFSLHSSPGAYGVLLGAGVSAPSGIPTAWGVIEDLAARVAQLSGEDPDNAVAWYEKKFRQAARYEHVLERLAPTPLERQRLLRTYFEPTEEDRAAGRKGPTVAHRSLARLVRSGTIKVIVTLNFDRLMEQAVRAEGMEPTIVASASDAAGLGPLHLLDCCIVHLHGDYLSPASMLNTADELKSYSLEMGNLLRRILQDYGLIIAGWSSLSDPALRDEISRTYSSRWSLAWVEPFQPPAEAVELNTRKKGTLFQASADQAFGELADAVQALTTRNARHPLTVPVAVETAKRELAGNTLAISLHDRLSRELNRLHNVDEFHLPDHQDDAAYGGYEAMVARVREASKVPTALVATLAYWGRENTDRWWLDDVRRLAINARGGGLTRLLTLRHVAGSALFYAAGVAAVAARRYDLVRRLFNLERPNPYRGSDESVLNVFTSDDLPEDASRETLFDSVMPILQEALSIGDDALDDAWQEFEVLRIADLAMRRPAFQQNQDAYFVENQLYLELNDKYELAQRDGADLTEMNLARTAAWQAQDRRLGDLARLNPVGRPHVLAADVRGDEGYRNPIAEKLALDLATEGTAHELAELAGAAGPSAFALALRATSVAIGRVGRELSWARVGSQVGVVPMEMWLDSAMTPGERDRSHRD